MSLVSERIHQLVEAQSRRQPAAIAIEAPGRAALTYGRLYQHMAETARSLNCLGIGRGDRVAMTLPDGPELAVAWLAVSTCATAAPLNPAYTTSELASYLPDLRPTALVVPSGIDSPAREIARALDIALIELSPIPSGEAGLFRLVGDRSGRTVRGGFAQPDDIALVLHTSGTIARPKVVPLTHANVCAAVRGFLAALELDSRDRCLNLIPLYHIGGLVHSVLCSLAAGGSVVCAADFSTGRFFEWLEGFRPTWYLAGPAVQQAILTDAVQHRDTIAGCPLRFIRFGAAPLPAPVIAEIERVFGAPVIQGYGMTETAARITTNPLPPGRRKMGSVGLVTTPEVAIMDETGELLPANRAGEIVVRGANVFQGYENNPAANESAFVGGWFRTGDQGYLDEEGYLYLTGRLREIINRGGGKISPREVDEALLEHPAVAEAVTFALPHPTLGEDVAAAVVLRQRAAATEDELRAFVAQRLAAFKVPRRVIILKELPKGPTGKPQRIDLAEKLRLTVPRDALEHQLAKIWEAILGIKGVGVHDDFFDLGGHSLLAMTLFARIEEVLGVSLPVTTLLQAPTIEQLAGILRQSGARPRWSSLVPLQPGGTKPPFVWVHALGGHVLGYRNLARYLGPDQPSYALQSRGLDGRRPPAARVEEMAADYVEELCRLDPAGPYFLGGLSFGGLIAFEMAQQLRLQGRQVALLALLDTYGPGYARMVRQVAGLRFAIYRLLQSVDFHRGNLTYLEPREQWVYAREKAEMLLRRIRRSATDVRPWQPVRHTGLAVEAANRRAGIAYIPQVYPGRLALFRARRQPLGRFADLTLGWSGLATGGVEVYDVPGYHASIIVEPNVQVLAQRLSDCLRVAQEA